MPHLLSLALKPLASRLLTFEGDFSEPLGEPAVVGADSVSWRVFSNPVTLYVGGIAAVLLELGEPRVRAGVWDNSSFREKPAERMRRTGSAAMITVFAARSRFEALAAQVNAIHSRIAGRTADGQSYRADDPDLLLWVQATASFAFLAAYTRFVRPLGAAQRDLYYSEAGEGALLYQVAEPPRSEAEVERLFAAMAPQLTASEVTREFLAIMRAGAVLPLPLRPLQPLIVRAALAIIPPRLRARIGVERESLPTAAEPAILRSLARAAGSLRLPNSPWALACARLGLPPDYLQTNPAAASAAPPRS